MTRARVLCGLLHELVCFKFHGNLRRFCYIVICLKVLNLLLPLPLLLCSAQPLFHFTFLLSFYHTLPPTYVAAFKSCHLCTRAATELCCKYFKIGWSESVSARGFTLTTFTADDVDEEGESPTTSLFPTRPSATFFYQSHSVFSCTKQRLLCLSFVSAHVVVQASNVSIISTQTDSCATGCNRNGRAWCLCCCCLWGVVRRTRRYATVMFWFSARRACKNACSSKYLLSWCWKIAEIGLRCNNNNNNSYTTTTHNDTTTHTRGNFYIFTAFMRALNQFSLLNFIVTFCWIFCVFFVFFPQVARTFVRN